MPKPSYSNSSNSFVNNYNLLQIWRIISFPPNLAMTQNFRAEWEVLHERLEYRKVSKPIHVIPLRLLCF